MLLREVNPSSYLGQTQGLARISRAIYEVWDYKSEKSAPMYCFKGTIMCMIHAYVFVFFSFLDQSSIGWLRPSNVLPVFDITKHKALCSAVKDPIGYCLQGILNYLHSLINQCAAVLVCQVKCFCCFAS